MDNLGTEVSNKIRSAIKAKLIELDAYVDDELPDYIMVMVANDRTKVQMEEDLGLFLNENTIAFTTWLHNVLDKLRKVTLDEVAKKDTSGRKKKKKKEPKKKEKDKEKKKKIKVSKEKDKKIKKVVGKEDKNANTVELGAKKSKPESSEGGVEKEEYDAEAILKKAVKSSVKSLKVNPVKSGTPTKKVKRKKITSLKEDQELFKPNKTKGDSKTRARSRSYSIERRGVASLVQVVRKRRSRSRSPSYEEYRNKRSVASKAILPPRPSRPTGRDDKGVARVLSRSMIDADRSILKSRRHVSPPAAYRKVRSPISSRSPVLKRRSREDDRRDVSARRSPDDRSRRFPRLSPEDIERFQMIKEQYKKGEGHRLKENLDKRKKDKTKDETRRLKREVDLLSSRQLAMDRELEKLGRASSLDRELKRKKEDKKRKSKIETVELEEEDDDEIRIIVRRDDEEVDEEKEEEEDEVVERVVVQVEEADEVSPPKKARKSVEEEKEVRKLELEDAELLEMRKKALESLMRKRAEERNVEEMRDRRGKEEVDRRTRQEVELRARDEVGRRGREEGRKIIIPLNDESTSNSDSSSSDTDSEVSLSEEEGEPTFIVTMDGIDEQYFKYKQKKAEQGGKEKKTILGEPVVSRHSPDDELQLHPEEQFDSPGQSPGGLKQNIKPGSQTSSVKMIPGIERPKSKPLKQAKPKTESKPVGPVTGSIRESKPESKPEPKPKSASVIKEAPKVVAPQPSAVKPVQASPIGSARQQTKISKQVIKPSVPTAVTTKPTLLTKPVSLEGSTTSKPVSGPATKPSTPASATVKPVYKKVLAVKPSVANPVKTAITINAKDAGAKPKRTPITAPPAEFPAKKIISLKPVFKPVSFVNPYTSSQGKSGELCIYYPKCIRGNQCFYRHPSPAEAILLKPSAPQQFRWSAR